MPSIRIEGGVGKNVLRRDMKLKSFYNYKSQLKPLARNLRKNMTLSEVLLWEQMKNKQLLDCKFRRQVPIGGFIIDFYCKELHLALEIDGNSHDYKIEHDALRNKYLQELGITVLHINDIDVKKNMQLVIEYIVEKIKELEIPIKPTPAL